MCSYLYLYLCLYVYLCLQVRGSSSELVRAASEILDLHLRHVEQLHEMRARTAKKESEYAAAQVRER